jgi:glutamyl-tRNA reductase
MFGIIGISFKTAPIEIREKYSFTSEESIVFLRQLKIDPDLKGAMLLSTCNRMEIYFHFEKTSVARAFDSIFRNLEFFKKTVSRDRTYFYSMEEERVAEHLFKVVSGLESLILGEDQIVTQVKQCFKLSLDNDFSSPVLTRLFNKAFEAGKRVRTETSINQGMASISSAAVDLLCKRFPDIRNMNIVLIGTGLIGELALANLVKRKCRYLYVTNRTYNKALDLGGKYGVKPFELERLDEYLPQSDIVLVATGAQKHIITREIVETFINDREKTQVYMDLSVPRNISTEILNLPHVELFAVDDLQWIVKDTQNKRKEAVSEAMEIIDIVRQEFNDWLCALELTPSILKIKKNIEDVNSTELEGFIRINDISDIDLVARYADHITNKFARLFISNLKDVTENGKRREYMKILNRLFEFSNSNEVPAEPGTDN